MYTRQGLVGVCVVILLLIGTFTLLILGIDTQPMYRPLAILGASLTILTCLYIMVDFTLAGWFLRRKAEIEAQQRRNHR